MLVVVLGVVATGVVGIVATRQMTLLPADFDMERFVHSGNSGRSVYFVYSANSVRSVSLLRTAQHCFPV